MNGFNAYANYCEPYDYCYPKELPRFSNVEDYIEHAWSLFEDSSVHGSEKKYKEWLDTFVAQYCGA